MSLAEGLLIIVIIILTVMIIQKHRASGVKDCNTAAAPAPVAPQSSSPEHFAIKENAEYFATGEPHSSDYEATSEFGKTAGGFKDWVVSQGVDAQVIKNHRAFVSDLLSDDTKNVTGRTYALGEVEGTDQVPWQGIRGRPVALPDAAKSGGLQVADVDPNAFSKKPKFNWSSS